MNVHFSVVVNKAQFPSAKIKLSFDPDTTLFDLQNQFFVYSMQSGLVALCQWVRLSVNGISVI